jgi:hypothetical protein
MVCFRITTADGRRYVGSVLGHGGELGGGAAHCGPTREKEAAARELQHSIDALDRTGRWSGAVLQVRENPGHCFVTSVKDWQVPHDGAFNVHHIPLAGAKFTVLSEDEILSIQPGTCREDIPDEKAALAAERLLTHQRM